MTSFFIGFFAKTIASLDDMITRIPVLTALTRTRRGKIAFSLGTLIATAVIIAIAQFFSFLLLEIQYANYITSSLIILLGVLVYFEVLTPSPRIKLRGSFIGADKISLSKLTLLLWYGFFISLITLIDDTIVLLPLFEEGNELLLIAGIYTATIIEIAFVIWGSGKLKKIRHKKEIATIALFAYAVLVFSGVI